MPMVLGVAGSIATGKSGMCAHLVERYGVIHGDADKIVHRMFDPGTPGFDNAVKEFGREIVGADGYIDRKRVGNIVFGNAEKLEQWMRAIGDIDLKMKETVAEWRATLGADDVAILEAVNLVETGYSEWCDATWLVAADDAIATSRLIARNSLTEAEAAQRLASQRSWTVRAPAADHVFHNNGSWDDFIAEVDRTFEETLARYRAGTLPRTNWFTWKAAQPSG